MWMWRGRDVERRNREGRGGRRRGEEEVRFRKTKRRRDGDV
jgi:hypothetical protein